MVGHDVRAEKKESTHAQPSQQREYHNPAFPDHAFRINTAKSQQNGIKPQRIITLRPAKGEQCKDDKESYSDEPELAKRLVKDKRPERSQDRKYSKHQKTGLGN
ncbi:hypothetical protein SDC9_200501 [bioreactor metagenome]|uniref:Uncharacterized protein n=1 Tax=bioreactor metagenome TaxID=1076179 RepID=A0A645IND7_9ZZZZ